VRLPACWGIQWGRSDKLPGRLLGQRCCPALDPRRADTPPRCVPDVAPVVEEPRLIVLQGGFHLQLNATKVIGLLLKPATEIRAEADWKV